ncbi:hypothetical protein L873DRAFT_53178 [Choiromyces venosus 120613-1]|uniref:Uncharacterized protein n=1 Tax=Choiromyces venosus 120613-1 TaxID=1336337 RepID=A0A3N4J5F3_9PEZI|nr:hypothetical protein L873DRAFT_53178 [Choiromyces venosus 120613-1]
MGESIRYLSRSRQVISLPCNQVIYRQYYTVAPRHPGWPNFMDSIWGKGVSGTAKRGFYFKKMLFQFSYQALSQQIFICNIDTSYRPFSRHTCSMVFIPPFITICPNILHLRLSPLEHSLPSTSGSAGQLSIGTRGGFLKISYESETSPFPVQRVKFYDDSEAPEILYGSARYPVQRDPGSEVRLYSSAISNTPLIHKSDRFLARTQPRIIDDHSTAPYTSMRSAATQIQVSSSAIPTPALPKSTPPGTERLKSHSTA